MDQIDHRLMSIKPPKFIHRMPRSINDLKHWKASEFKVFCFYYALPIFEGIMRFDYFQHLLKLICGLYILSCDSIDVNMVEVARDLLNCFIRDFEQLYGLRYCSINIHLLIHLPDSVKNLGPLWAHTCYESEDLNGQLLKLLHGTWHIDSQLTRSQSQFITMARFIELSA
ncbi:GSCOCG00012514001-RA-CDS, partial [Cotesia congregata]